MTRGPDHWTTPDLELYHDEELDAARRVELSDALRRSPDLRERLSTVRRVDDLVRCALVREFPARPSERRQVLYRIAMLGAVACVLAAVIASVWLAVQRRAARTVEVVERAAPLRLEDPVEPEYEAIRVVLSVPIRARPARTVDEPAQPPDAPAYAEVASVVTDQRVVLLTRLEAALANRRIEEAIKLLDDASGSQRATAYRYLGQLLGSALVAREILDRLSAREQLAACREWAHEPARRPVVFARLRRLSKESDLAEDVRVLVAKLAEDPRLRSWIRGYQLAPPSLTGRGASS